MELWCSSNRVQWLPEGIRKYTNILSTAKHRKNTSTFHIISIIQSEIWTGSYTVPGKLKSIYLPWDLMVWTYGQPLCACYQNVGGLQHFVHILEMLPLHKESPFHLNYYHLSECLLEDSIMKTKYLTHII